MMMMMNSRLHTSELVSLSETSDCTNQTRMQLLTHHYFTIRWYSGSDNTTLCRLFNHEGQTKRR